MTIPQQSALREYAKGAYFSDSFSVTTARKNKVALDIFIEMAQEMPSWISFLMDRRNQIVSKLGLKNLGRFQDLKPGKTANAYKPGDRVGIFTLISSTDDEAIFEDSDKHLDVRVSILRDVSGDKETIHATTVVHIHNMLGRLYMFPVIPIHKLIVPASLKTLTK
ncbi:DUF2867 domain-containing protein [Veronia pacifica]|uniref:DUF2867 domain-containing protein n=1 Tax=Veronia pacifica TaxID=1080227 RepID=A0A1C3ED17_9GAMM|nr:DUF2867 domain-containing protein [Veronia pacifica]ODA31142.1 hypothetical protein A8L45_17975 [Veronia pacifica]